MLFCLLAFTEAQSVITALGTPAITGLGLGGLGLLAYTVRKIGEVKPTIEWKNKDRSLRLDFPDRESKTSTTASE